MSNLKINLINSQTQKICDYFDTLFSSIKPHCSVYMNIFTPKKCRHPVALRNPCRVFHYQYQKFHSEKTCSKQASVEKKSVTLITD